ncbi:MAG: PKD domain-containing protein [Salinigranum sp.]
MAAAQISTDASDWTSAGPAAHGVSDTTDGGVELSWNNDGALNGASWTFTTTATATGSQKFDWVFSGCHSWYRSDAKAYAFADGPDGTTTTLLSDRGSCQFSDSGTATIDVTRGYAFGIVVTGYHWDSSRLMHGTFTLSLPNAAPTAAFSFSPASPVTGSPVSFDASGSSDPDGDSLTYAWDFGGEGTATGVAPDFAFAAGGDKTVTLTVSDPSGAVDSTSETVSVAWSLDIDVKPGNGDETDSITPGARGNIPVVVYSTDDLDATTLDVSTLRFGPGGASVAHGGHAEDVDGDGLVDLLLHFPSEDAGFSDGDTEATLAGQTSDGTDAVGTDEIRTVGDKPEKPREAKRKGK